MVYPSKDTVKKVKKKSTEWEKIFVNIVSDKESRIYKELQLNNKKHIFLK